MIKWNFRLLPIGSEKGHILQQDELMKLKTELHAVPEWLKKGSLIEQSANTQQD